MAIPAQPSNFIVQQGNQQVYLSWSNSAGALSYSIQKSTDNVIFTVLASPAGNSYIDVTAVQGTQYYYNVASVNVSGTSPYTASQGIVVAPNGELSLGQLRLRAQQRADLVNSQFITTEEWNYNINQSMLELYDLLVTAYEDYFLAPAIYLNPNGVDTFYPLPNGTNTFLDAQGNTITPPAFYKLMGVDLALNQANNAYVTLNKFAWIDRNRYIYPTAGGTQYGAFNLQYRIMGNNVDFIPTPLQNQNLKLWYIPRLPVLVQDTDVTTIGYSGWLEYVIIDAAIKAMQKEESDVTILAAEKMMMIKRIEETAMNRDAGRPDTIMDVRSNVLIGNGSGYGGNGPIGGY